MACEKCSGDCGACGGCAKELELSPWEIEIIRALGQFSFLPVARRREDMVPVYLEESRHTVQEYSLILQCLEKKGLISLDYDKPLSGADMCCYKGYPVHGSMALTQRGHTVLEILETQGIL